MIYFFKKGKSREIALKFVFQVQIFDLLHILLL